MKKIVLIIIIIFYPLNVYSQDNIVFLDVQYIIDNSEIGKFYKDEIKKIQDIKKSELINIEENIKNKETEINNQKNILKKEEIDKKVKDLNKFVKNYQIQRNNFNKEISKNKKDYSIKILNILNPLLTKYVEKNNIKLVVEKKNILVGIKSLDITSDILKILNEETKNRGLLNEN